MVVKAAGFEVSDSIPLTCTDKDSVPAWAKPYVATAMHKGVVKGYEDGSFRPSNDLPVRRQWFGTEGIRNRRSAG